MCCTRQKKSNLAFAKVFGVAMSCSEQVVEDG